MHRSLWSGAEWSNAAALANNLSRSGSSPFAVTSLRDGRIAIANGDDTGAIRAGFFNGTKWTELKTVPLAPAATLYANRRVALARGVSAGVILELVYLADDRIVRHARLTNEASWTWSTPTMVKPSGTYDMVHLTASP
ncbi:hypothetical protein LVJ94_49050 [Pendulispora rubella]|uniref:Uncharacterized protein n=1 Tax=Pendulispora rubella TaxID=2741070 RepID=A0ABZ2L6L8_9BACT